MEADHHKTADDESDFQSFHSYRQKSQYPEKDQQPVPIQHSSTVTG